MENTISSLGKGRLMASFIFFKKGANQLFRERHSFLYYLSASVVGWMAGTLIFLLWHYFD